VISTRARIVRVCMLSAASTRGAIGLGASFLACALGKGGSLAIKREGDGASPRGMWPVRCVLYRADRIVRPRTSLPVRALKPDDGWCDAPTDRNYNRHVRHPYPASAERLWRSDHLYDVVVVLGHNDRPRRRGMGSAIFVHLARDGYQPTDGCIALAARDLQRALKHIGPTTRVRIG
jgi:L,D-peptidoglycan transpeptidase YkuD (ErfK/YbiS/YcfS/YnhG family)